MNANSENPSPSDLSCYRCGYNLRAHPPDGTCPECGGSIAESRRAAAIPSRPAWKDSDPRWRRRMLAGAWLLVLLPLMDVLQKFGWASQLPVPNFWGDGPITLDATYLDTRGVFPAIAFSIGAVLLFSKERGRRRNRLDWTRRWGVIASYVVTLLTAALIVWAPALVLVGISALFMDLPAAYQPRLTRLFTELSTKYLRYGPYPKNSIYCVRILFSSATMLLACVPLYQALSSTGRKVTARILLIPLALFAMVYIAQATLRAFDPSALAATDPFYLLGPFFRPGLLVNNRAPWGPPWSTQEFVVECIKWCVLLTIAILLTVAQITPRRTTSK